MPAVTPAVLVDSILDAIQQSGATVIYVSKGLRVHPREFVVQYLEDTFSLWIYIWTLTHGGRVSLPDEYRIQMTTVPSPLPLNPDFEGYTVLLGFYPDLDVFAGFDIQKHGSFTAGSPSVQIGIDALQRALQDGLAFTTKENQEIAVAIRPDQFVNYIFNAKSLHEFGGEVSTLNLLKKATQTEEITQQEIQNFSTERQRMITEVIRFSRMANFRRQVLNAYENRCAVTRTQLKLVDAAHILPVRAEGSIDHVSNGLALSPTMHRAYDNGLIYLDENHSINLNDKKVRELKAQNLHGGLNLIAGHLNRQIHLPADRNQWPRVEFIQMANRYRRIEGYC